jgi:hypothetical protein
MICGLLVTSWIVPTQCTQSLSREKTENLIKIRPRKHSFSPSITQSKAVQLPLMHLHGKRTTSNRWQVCQWRLRLCKGHFLLIESKNENSDSFPDLQPQMATVLRRVSTRSDHLREKLFFHEHNTPFRQTVKDIIIMDFIFYKPMFCSHCNWKNRNAKAEEASKACLPIIIILTTFVWLQSLVSNTITIKTRNPPEQQ